MTGDDSIPPVVCTLTPDEAAARAGDVEDALVARYERAEERDDGYTLAFEGTDESLSAAAAFVADELECCSFAEYEIAVSPPYEETRLTITGPEGTKELFGEGLVGLLEAASEG